MIDILNELDAIHREVRMRPSASGEDVSVPLRRNYPAAVAGFRLEGNAGTPPHPAPASVPRSLVPRPAPSVESRPEWCFRAGPPGSGTAEASGVAGGESRTLGAALG